MEGIVSFFIMLLANFFATILNLIPVGNVFNLLDLTNKEVITALFDFNFLTNSSLGKFLIILVGVILIVFVFWLIVLVLNFTMHGLAELLFKKKVDGFTDKDNDLLGLGDFRINSQSLKTLHITSKGFIGEIINRIHQIKLASLNIATGEDKIKYFGPFTIILGFLFGIFSSKELKKYGFLKAVVIVIITLASLYFIGKIGSVYTVKYFQGPKNSIVKLDDTEDKIQIKEGKYEIRNIGDILLYIFYVDMLGNGNNLQNSYTISDIITNKFIETLKKVKQLGIQDDNFPLFVKLYLSGKIDLEEVRDFYYDMPFFAKLTSFYMLQTHLKTNNNLADRLFQTILQTTNYTKVEENIYRLYKRFNNNVAINTLEKVIFFLHLMPLYHSDAYIKLDKAKEFFGDVNKWNESKVIENDTFVSSGVNQKVINEARKKLYSPYVTNPKYIVRVWGIFPVSPISLNKTYNVIYLVFLLVLSFIWFVIMILFLGVGRFLYLYLLRAILDEKQRENFQIDWGVELQDTLIRMLMFFFIYYFILGIITTQLF